MPVGRILVVDDAENAAWIRDVLADADHDVSTAASGLEARGLVDDREFDLVLSNLRLPDIDGLGFMADVRGAAPDTVCIVLTGEASLDSAIKALRQGAYDYLVKPCTVEELRTTVNRGLERRRLGQQLRARVSELERANDTITALNADLQRRIASATAELRSQFERLQELDRLKTQFMSVASHELKTPITAMSGFLQVALRRLRRGLEAGHPDAATWETETTATIEQLEVVHRQTGKLARLIDELLDVTRIQSGRVEFRYATVDVTQLAGEIAQHMQTTTTDHVLRVEADGGATLTGDRDHLEQMITNLLANAIKYSPEGGEIDVRVVPEADEVALSVRDQGMGIPQQELEAVFGLFYRSPDRATRDVGGMGIGLYISRQIVERHGGRIWAESGPEGGATFHVRLPRMAVTARDADPPEVALA